MASTYVCDLTRDSLAKVLLPINYAVGVQGGSQTAVLLLRALQSEGNHLLSCDFANAFNTVLRSKIFEALAAEPSLSKLAPLAHWLYGSPSSLYVRGQGQELHHIAPARAPDKVACWVQPSSAWPSSPSTSGR